MLGRSAADAHSLTASVFNPGLVSMTGFQNVQAKRLAVQTAFLKADSDLRLRRAMTMQNFKELKNKVSDWAALLLLAHPGHRHSPKQQVMRTLQVCGGGDQ